MKRISDSGKALYKNMRMASPANILIFLILLALITAIFFIGEPSYKIKLAEGDISVNDVYAPYNFTYPGNIDEAKTNELKEKALTNFLPVYARKPEYWAEKEKALRAFFKDLDSAKKLAGDDENVRVEKLKKLSNTALENNLLLALLKGDPASLEETGIKAFKGISSKVIADDNIIEELISNKKSEITVLSPKTGAEAKVPRAELYTKVLIKPIIEKELVNSGIDDEELRQAIASVTASPLDSNIAYDKAETETRRKAILEKISPVYTQVLVKKNELIIGKGERVHAAHLVQLGQLAEKEKARFKTAYSGGVAIILGLLVIILIVYLDSYRSKAFLKSKKIYLIFTVILLNIFLAKVIVISPLVLYIMPVATAAMLLTMLLDTGCAFMVAILLSVITGVIAGNKFDITVASMIGSITGIYFVKGIRRRSELLKAGVVVGLGQFLVICGLGLLTLLEVGVFLREGMWGFASGIISAAIVMLLLPIFEWLFGLTTDITLLELSDLNHPLLRRMVLEAPGTYHHSLVVGNLAEAASESIGANSLLARVGAYYHDIGKIEKAEYFSENEMENKSHHEKLAPSMSALIITSHVKDGVEIAKKYKLDKALIDFISQHHGTGLIYYFYQRALEKLENEETLREEGFRYGGPKPQTKEAAIVLLADSVEAASRALDDPTPARIKSLVQKVINNKFIDSQLDECDLTLKDMHNIAESFVRILTGIFHTRVEYPENGKAKSKSKNTK
ncbi:MAG: HDIG domain-containing metalloprotein [Candidatus Omnitrophota bacterium]